MKTPTIAWFQKKYDLKDSNKTIKCLKNIVKDTTFNEEQPEKGKIRFHKLLSHLELKSLEINEFKLGGFLGDEVKKQISNFVKWLDSNLDQIYSDITISKEKEVVQVKVSVESKNFPKFLWSNSFEYSDDLRDHGVFLIFQIPVEIIRKNALKILPRGIFKSGAKFVVYTKVTDNLPDFFHFSSYKLSNFICHYTDNVVLIKGTIILKNPLFLISTKDGTTSASSHSSTEINIGDFKSKADVFIKIEESSLNMALVVKKSANKSFKILGTTVTFKSLESTIDSVDIFSHPSNLVYNLQGSLLLGSDETIEVNGKYSDTIKVISGSVGNLDFSTTISHLLNVKEIEFPFSLSWKKADFSIANKDTCVLSKKIKEGIRLNYHSVLLKIPEWSDGIKIPLLSVICHDESIKFSAKLPQISIGKIVIKNAELTINHFLKAKEKVETEISIEGNIVIKEEGFSNFINEKEKSQLLLSKKKKEGYEVTIKSSKKYETKIFGKPFSIEDCSLAVTKNKMECKIEQVDIYFLSIEKTQLNYLSKKPKKQYNIVGLLKTNPKSSKSDEFVKWFPQLNINGEFLLLSDGKRDYYIVRITKFSMESLVSKLGVFGKLLDGLKLNVSYANDDFETMEGDQIDGGIKIELNGKDIWDKMKFKFNPDTLIKRIGLRGGIPFLLNSAGKTSLGIDLGFGKGKKKKGSTKKKLAFLVEKLRLMINTKEVQLAFGFEFQNFINKKDPKISVKAIIAANLLEASGEIDVDLGKDQIMTIGDNLKLKIGSKLAVLIALNYELFASSGLPSGFGFMGSITIDEISVYLAMLVNIDNPEENLFYLIIRKLSLKNMMNIFSQLIGKNLNSITFPNKFNIESLELYVCTGNFKFGGTNYKRKIFAKTIFNFLGVEGYCKINLTKNGFAFEGILKQIELRSKSGDGVFKLSHGPKFNPVYVRKLINPNEGALKAVSNQKEGKEIKAKHGKIITSILNSPGPTCIINVEKGKINTLLLSGNVYIFGSFISVDASVSDKEISFSIETKVKVPYITTNLLVLHLDFKYNRERFDIRVSGGLKLNLKQFLKEAIHKFFKNLLHLKHANKEHIKQVKKKGDMLTKKFEGGKVGEIQKKFIKKRKELSKKHEEKIKLVKDYLRKFNEARKNYETNSKDFKLEIKEILKFGNQFTRELKKTDDIIKIENETLQKLDEIVKHWKKVLKNPEIEKFKRDAEQRKYLETKVKESKELFEKTPHQKGIKDLKELEAMVSVGITSIYDFNTFVKKKLEETKRIWDKKWYDINNGESELSSIWTSIQDDNNLLYKHELPLKIKDKIKKYKEMVVDSREKKELTIWEILLENEKGLNKLSNILENAFVDLYKEELPSKKLQPQIMEFNYQQTYLKKGLVDFSENMKNLSESLDKELSDKSKLLQLFAGDFEKSEKILDQFYLTNRRLLDAMEKSQIQDAQDSNGSFGFVGKFLSVLSEIGNQFIDGVLKFSEELLNAMVDSIPIEIKDIEFDGHLTKSGIKIKMNVEIDVTIPFFKETMKFSVDLDFHDIGSSFESLIKSIVKKVSNKV